MEMDWQGTRSTNGTRERHSTSRGGLVAVTQDVPDQLEELVSTAHRIRQAIESVIEGKSDAVRLTLTVLLAEGHLLIEDVPRSEEHTSELQSRFDLVCRL